MDELVLYTNKYEYFSDVSQPSLGVEHELTTNAMGEMDTETPAMRASMVSVHQRSPGGMHGQMETHWEENNGPACRYFNKHFTRSVHTYIYIHIYFFCVFYKRLFYYFYICTLFNDCHFFVCTIIL